MHGRSYNANIAESDYVLHIYLELPKHMSKSSRGYIELLISYTSHLPMGETMVPTEWGVRLVRFMEWLWILSIRFCSCRPRL
jgi:hypothetical protein